MTPRTRDPEATRAAILSAAEEVILEHGFGRATTSEIAQRAKVTKSLLHHHFGTKEGLWEEVKRRRFAEYAERQLEMLRTQAPSEDLLRDSMHAYFHFLKENPQTTRMLAWLYLEQMETCGQDAGHRAELIELGVRRLREGQEAGALRRDVDMGLFLMIFIGVIQHWFQDRAFHLAYLGEGASPEELDRTFLETMTTVLMEGVLPR